MLPDDFGELLSCAILEPELRSLLVFDFPSEPFDAAVDRTAALLRHHLATEIDIVRLGATHTEDSLWGYPRDSVGTANPLSALLPPGMLGGPWREGRFTLVVMPDLANLSLAASRAAIVGLQSPTVSLQRHGENRSLPCRAFWLAQCRNEDLSRVSPHLLDRFALRYAGARFSAGDKVARLKAALAGEAPTEPAVSPAIADAGQRLARAATLRAEEDPAIVTEVLNYFPRTKGREFSGRRPIMLHRLALTLGRLRAAEHHPSPPRDYVPPPPPLTVRAAAALLGLSAPASSVPPAADPPAPKPSPGTTVKPAAPAPETNRPAPAATGRPGGVESTVPIQKTDDPVIAAKTATAVRFSTQSNPFPEDAVTVEPEAVSLRPPARGAHGQARGVVIGVRRARDMSDIAICGTVLEAAKYQHLRRGGRASGRFTLVPSDLRSYRRLPVAEHLLVLVLDYTSLGASDWRTALLPHLIDSYVSRAELCLVQVGASDAETELRARRIDARSVLVPAFATALAARPGRATPLADGLDRALSRVRRALQHGRSRVSDATLVVVSDARGNIPLAWSQRGHREASDRPGGRQGVTDALDVARRIAALHGVTSIVIAPNAAPATSLPAELAAALNAELTTVEPAETRTP